MDQIGFAPRRNFAMEKSMQGTDSVVFVNLITYAVPLYFVLRASVWSDTPLRVLVPAAFSAVAAIGFCSNYFVLDGGQFESIRFGLLNGIIIGLLAVFGRKYIRPLYKRTSERVK